MWDRSCGGCRSSKESTQPAPPPVTGADSCTSRSARVRRVSNGAAENREINRARTTLEHKLMRTPTIKEIAQYLEVTKEQVIEALEGNNVFYPKSLSMEFDNNSDGQETTLMDLIGEEDEQIDNIANVEDLRQRLATLNPVERMIIEERYYKGKTQKEVAAIIGKSQMTVSRLEKKVMEKLRSDK